MIIVKEKLTDDQLLNEIYKSAKEYERLLNKNYLIIGKNRHSDYFWFECFFEKKHFMHLLGINSRNLSANAFFDRCKAHNKGEDAELKINDCTPSRNHNRNTINKKSSCCAALLRIQEAKYMNIGKKDKINQYVDFSYAYGKEAFLGFKESSQGGCFPITLMTQNIDTVSTKKYKIIIVFQKEKTDEKYGYILSEIKEGIFPEIYNDAFFPDSLKKLIETERSTISKKNR